MSCAGRGVCGCGAERCAENAWWFHFCGVWLLFAFDLLERQAALNAITDDDIDFAREQQL